MSHLGFGAVSVEGGIFYYGINPAGVTAVTGDIANN
jgi:hypothetical protein